MTRDIYIAIMVADALDRPLRLTADEVARLAADEAIRAAALNGLDDAEWPENGTGGAPNWRAIRPLRQRTPANGFCIAPEDLKPSSVIGDKGDSK